MQSLKITTVGDSQGVVLPKELLDKLRVGQGDVLYLVEDKDGYRITPYDEEFARQMTVAEQLMREDRDVLKVFAK
ncbi:MAG: AbrB/MazE/SpoVT family DNA-binding domain-containing protein [Deltaproteobacteria bacterium]|nr:AbrB/MazE/SpoVT family DNA-binding domain-containing protein [Deltaproteobacteria bacterium]